MAGEFAKLVGKVVGKTVGKATEIKNDVAQAANSFADSVQDKAEMLATAIKSNVADSTPIKIATSLKDTAQNTFNRAIAPKIEAINKGSTVSEISDSGTPISEELHTGLIKAPIQNYVENKVEGGLNTLGYIGPGYKEGEKEKVHDLVIPATRKITNTVSEGILNPKPFVQSNVKMGRELYDVFNRENDTRNIGGKIVDTGIALSRPVVGGLQTFLSATPVGIASTLGIQAANEATGFGEYQQKVIDASADKISKLTGASLDDSKKRVEGLIGAISTIAGFKTSSSLGKIGNKQVAAEMIVRNEFKKNGVKATNAEVRELASNIRNNITTTQQRLSNIKQGAKTISYATAPQFVNDVLAAVTGVEDVGMVDRAKMYGAAGLSNAIGSRIGVGEGAIKTGAKAKSIEGVKETAEPIIKHETIKESSTQKPKQPSDSFAGLVDKTRYNTRETIPQKEIANESFDTRYQDAFPQGSDKRLIADTYLDPRNYFIDVTEKLSIDDRLSDNEKSVITSEIGNRSRWQEQINQRYNTRETIPQKEEPILETIESADNNPIINQDNIQAIEQEAPATAKQTLQEVSSPETQQQLNQSLADTEFNQAIGYSAKEIDDSSIGVKGESDVSQEKSLQITEESTATVDSEKVNNPKTDADNVFDKHLSAINNSEFSLYLFGSSQSENFIGRTLQKGYATITRQNSSTWMQAIEAKIGGVSYRFKDVASAFGSLANRISDKFAVIMPSYKDGFQISEKPPFDFRSLIDQETYDPKANLVYSITDKNAKTIEISHKAYFNQLKSELPNITDNERAILQESAIYNLLERNLDLLTNRYTPEEITYFRDARLKQDEATRLGGEDLTKSGWINGQSEHYRSATVPKGVYKDVPSNMIIKIDGEKFVYDDAVEYIKQKEMEEKLSGKTTTNYAKYNTLLQKASEKADMHFYRVYGPHIEALRYKKNIYKIAEQDAAYRFIKSLQDAENMKNYTHNMTADGYDNMYATLLEQHSKSGQVIRAMNAMTTIHVFTANITNAVYGAFGALVKGNLSQVSSGLQGTIYALKNGNVGNAISAFTSAVIPGVASVGRLVNKKASQDLYQQLIVNGAIKGKDKSFRLDLLEETGFENSLSGFGKKLYHKWIAINTGSLPESDAIMKAATQNVGASLLSMGYDVNMLSANSILKSYDQFVASANDVDLMKLHGDVYSASRAVGDQSVSTQLGIRHIHPLTKGLKSFWMGQFAELFGSTVRIMDTLVVKRTINKELFEDASKLAIVAGSYHLCKALWSSMLDRTDVDDDAKDQMEKFGEHFFQQSVPGTQIIMANTLTAPLSSAGVSISADTMGRFAYAYKVGGDQGVWYTVDTMIRTLGLQQTAEYGKTVLNYDMATDITNRILKEIHGPDYAGTYSNMNAGLTQSEGFTRGDFLDRLRFSREAQLQDEMYLFRDMSKQGAVSDFLNIMGMGTFARQVNTNWDFAWKTFSDLTSEVQKQTVVDEEGNPKEVETGVLQIKKAENVYNDILPAMERANSYDSLMRELNISQDTKYYIKSNGSNRLADGDLQKGEQEVSINQIVWMKINDAIGYEVPTKGKNKGKAVSTYINKNNELEHATGITMTPTWNIKAIETGEAIPYRESMELLKKNNPHGYESLVNMLYELKEKTRINGSALEGKALNSALSLTEANAKVSHVVAQYEEKQRMSEFLKANPGEFITGEEARQTEVRAIQGKATTVLDPNSQNSIYTSIIGSKEYPMEKRVEKVKEVNELMMKLANRGGIEAINDQLAFGALKMQGVLVKFHQENPSFSFAKEAPMLLEMVEAGLELKGERNPKLVDQPSKEETKAIQTKPTGKKSSAGIQSGIDTSLPTAGLGTLKSTGIGLLKSKEIKTKPTQIATKEIQRPGMTLAQLLQQRKNK